MIPTTGTTLRTITCANASLGSIPAGTPVKFARLADGRVGLRELAPPMRGAWIDAAELDRSIRSIAADAGAVMALAGATPKHNPTTETTMQTTNTTDKTRDAVEAIFAAANVTAPAAPTAPRLVAAAGTTAHAYGTGRATLTRLNVEGGDSYAGESIVGECADVPSMLRAARLDWTVQAEPFTSVSGAHGGELRAIVRTDTQEVLAVRSQNFAVAQNDAVFAALGPIVAAGGRFRGAGSFRGGRTVFAQVDLGTYEVIPGDTVQMFAHIRDSRDGSHCWSLQIGSTRIVCANTLMHACKAGEFIAKSRHGKGYAANLDAARDALASMRGNALEIVRSYQRLAAWRITPADVRAMLDAVRPMPPAAKTDEERRARANAERERDEILAMIGGKQRGAYDIDNVLGTGWSALNGVTDWADHILAEARGGGSAKPITTLRRVTEGGAATVKAEAFDWLMEHAPAAVVARA